MADTNPAGQNLSAPLPAGQPPQKQNHRKRYMAALAAILVVAIGLGAYFLVGGQLFKGFIGEDYNALKECVEGLQEEVLINSEYPVTVNKGCTVQLASDGGHAKFVYARFGSVQAADSYDVTLTAETNLEDAGTAWYIGEAQLGIGSPKTVPFAEAGSYEVEMRISGEVGGKSVELVNSKTVVVTETVVVTDPVGGAPDPDFLCIQTAETLDVECTADDMEGTHKWNFGTGNLNGGQSTETHTYTSPGSYTITHEITKNNTSESTSIEFPVVAPAPPAPPNTSFSCTPIQGGPAPLTITCTAVAFGANYFWDFGDDSEPVAASDGAIKTHTYQNAGNYIVIYALTDGEDEVLASTTHPTITVTAAVPEGSPLVAHWTFDGQSQSTFIDSTDNNNNAEIKINLGKAVVYEDSPVNTAANFETDKGIYAEVAYSEGGSLNLTGPFTAMVWVKTASPGVLFNKYENVSNDNGYFVQLMDNGNIEFRTANSSANYSLVTTGQNILDNKWHPIAVVYGGSDQNADAIYVDGELATTGPGQFNTRSNSLGVTTRPFLIGKHSGTNPTPDTTFNGSLDDLRIYNGVMDEMSINTIFLSSAIPEGTPPPANSLNALNSLENYTPPAKEEALEANFSITEQFNTASGHQVQLADASTGPISTWIHDCDYDEGEIPEDDTTIGADPQLFKYTETPILSCMYEYPDNNTGENYNIGLKVIDANGNSNTFEHEDMISVTHPIQAQIACDKTSGPAPLEVDCTYQTDPSMEGSISNTNWNVKDSEGNSITTSSNPEIAYTFDTPGNYSIDLQLNHDPTYAIFNASVPVSVTAAPPAPSLSQATPAGAGCSDELCGAEPGEETVLLLHFDGDLVDSVSGNTMMAYNVNTSADDPKIGSYSAEFDGTTSTLSLNNPDVLTFGAEDWTIDYWVKTADPSANQVIFWIHDSANTAVVETQFYSGALKLYVNSNGTIDVNNYQPTLNTWEHHAIVRSGNNIKVFVDGSKQFDQDMSSGMSDGNMLAGQELVISYPGAKLFGFIDEFRIRKSEAVWTENFTPPTEPYDVAIANDTWNSRIASMLTADVFHASLEGVPALPANAFTANLGDTVKLITFDQPKENAVFVRFNDKQWDLDVKIPQVKDATPQDIAKTPKTIGSKVSTPKDKKVTTGKDEEPPKLKKKDENVATSEDKKPFCLSGKFAPEISSIQFNNTQFDITWEIDEKAVGKGLKGYDLKVGYYDGKNEYNSVSSDSLDKYKGNSGSEIIGKLDESAKSYLLQLFALYNDGGENITCTGSSKEFTVQKAPEEKKEDKKVTTIKPPEKKDEDKKATGEDDEPPALQGPVTITKLSAKVIDAEENSDPENEGKIPLQFAYKTKGFLNPTDRLAWYLKDADGDAIPVYEASGKADNEPVIAWYAPGEYSYKLAIFDADGKLRDEKLGGQIFIVFKETGTNELPAGVKAGDEIEVAVKITPEVVVGDIEPIKIPIVIETTVITKEITETVTVEGGGGGGGGGGGTYPQCSDNQNNDDDNFIDFPADPGCNNADDNTESPDPVTRIATKCSDGIDNDKNGFTDYPEDNGCINENDNSEETKFEIIASVEGLAKTEIADTIIKANNCLSKTPQNKITKLEDIKADNPAAEMIGNLQKLAYNGEPIIVGRQIKGKHYFEDKKPILRPEFFKLAAWPSCLAQSATAKGLWDTKKNKNFKDKEFDEKFWAYEIVNALTKLNIVEGYEDGTVGLANNITRAEILKLLLDAYALRVYLDGHDDIDFASYDKEAVLKEVFADSLAKYKKSPFPDMSEIDKHWSYYYATIAYDRGLTKGIENLFNGDEPATRLEAATMVYNFFIANIEKQQAEAVKAGVEAVKEVTFIRTFMTPRYGSF